MTNRELQQSNEALCDLLLTMRDQISAQLEALGIVDDEDPEGEGEDGDD